MVLGIPDPPKNSPHHDRNPVHLQDLVKWFAADNCRGLRQDTTLGKGKSKGSNRATTVVYENADRWKSMVYWWLSNGEIWDKAFIFGVSFWTNANEKAVGENKHLYMPVPKSLLSQSIVSWFQPWATWPVSFFGRPQPPHQ